MSGTEWATLGVFAAVVIGVSFVDPKAALGIVGVAGLVILLNSGVLAKATGTKQENN